MVLLLGVGLGHGSNLLADHSPRCMRVEVRNALVALTSRPHNGHSKWWLVAGLAPIAVIRPTSLQLLKWALKPTSAGSSVSVQNPQRTVTTLPTNLFQQ